MGKFVFTTRIRSPKASWPRIERLYWPGIGNPYAVELWKVTNIMIIPHWGSYHNYAWAFPKWCSFHVISWGTVWQMPGFLGCHGRPGLPKPYTVYCGLGPDRKPEICLPFFRRCCRIICGIFQFLLVGFHWLIVLTRSLVYFSVFACNLGVPSGRADLKYWGPNANAFEARLDGWYIFRD